MLLNAHLGLGVNMDGKKCRTLDFRLRGCRLTRIRKQTLCAAFTIIFPLTFWSPGVKNMAVKIVNIFR